MHCRLHALPIACAADCIHCRLHALLTAFPCVSSHFYHIRSLRERGHRLPYCFRFAAVTLLFPFCRCYLTVSVLPLLPYCFRFAAVTSPFPFCRCYLTVSVLPLLPYCFRFAAVTSPFPFCRCYFTVSVCCRCHLVSVNTVADLPACLLPFLLAAAAIAAVPARELLPFLKIFNNPSPFFKFI
ncbi:hypothetical protein [Methanimicrococcus hacksteinii]|uniref:hypothetical protein n=1 Tax=Methanimicrococcus hacksteinii TaxID=3028293 RepID=UPI00298EE81C|nr:hypothetical protein [Methanimicrococcus sp. At1]